MQKDARRTAGSDGRNALQGEAAPPDAAESAASSPIVGTPRHGILSSLDEALDTAYPAQG